MKTLTNQEKRILKQFVTEFKALIDPNDDIEGATIEAMLDGYLRIKCKPKASIELEEKVIYCCQTAKNAVAFLEECISQGIILITYGRSTISAYQAINLFDETITTYPLKKANFILTANSNKVRMFGVDVKAKKSDTVTEFRADKDKIELVIRRKR